MNDENITPNTEQPKGFSWLGFFFNGFYYAGYGDTKKASILLAIGGLIPGAALLAGLYAGFKAKAELPIGQQAFSWKRCVAAIGIYWVVTSIYYSIIISMLTGVPACDSADAEDLLSQIIYSQLRIELISLNEIEEVAYNEEKRVRVCSAKAITSTISEYFEYSITRTSDNDIYVEIRQ